MPALSWFCFWLTKKRNLSFRILHRLRGLTQRLHPLKGKPPAAGLRPLDGAKALDLIGLSDGGSGKRGSLQAFGLVL
ncbi:MAG: hypothetical protein ACPGNV_04100 [Mangrovicoccus sp.]